jgi:alpha-L-rhamnosidase
MSYEIAHYDDVRSWTGLWIGRQVPGWHAGWQGSEVLPAPLLRKTFRLDAPVASACVRICGLGYHELYINGNKVGTEVLSPVVTQYEQRVAYVDHDVAEYLQVGENVLGVMLGNGWYNCHTPTVWEFHYASWRDYPKLLLQLDVTLGDGSNLRVVSDSSWKFADSAITFDALRNGEHYDARLELPGWAATGFDDSAWQQTVVVSPPGGVLDRQIAPPCRVVETLEPVSSWSVGPGVRVFDLGQNITGWAHIAVTGSEGSQLTLRYGERLAEDRRVDQKHIGVYIKGGEPQTDRYILKESASAQSWEPRFTYHGFQYVQVEGPDEVLDTLVLQGRVVQTDFSRIGSFESSDPQLNRLHHAAVWSYRGNFVGIPTDCPHREKNGWTADTHLAAEFGLLHFDAGTAYQQWLLALADAQRLSGQLPAIIPTSGWGFNGYSGPAWDSAFLLIPWYIYLYTGDRTAIERHYEPMKRYVDYCARMASGHIVDFGLGDWNHPDRERMAPVALTTTAYYYVDAVLLARFAGLLGRDDDAMAYKSLAEEIHVAFNRAFYRGNGVYADGQQTAQACALYQGLVDPAEKETVVHRLVESVEATGVRPEIGILGIKYVTRALAENGQMELAYKLVTQPEYPGWMHWIAQGATTLWEDWAGKDSRNHPSFCDLGAWMIHHLAGIAPDPDRPGFRHALIQPCPVAGLDSARATHQTPHGVIRCGWERRDGEVHLEVELPPAVTAALRSPDGTTMELAPGTHHSKI